MTALQQRADLPSPTVLQEAPLLGSRDAVGEDGELFESLRGGIREAAFRGQEEGLIRRHIEDARRVLREAGHRPERFGRGGRPPPLEHQHEC
jgi:hypothetical protein